MLVDTHVHVIAPDHARYPLRPSGVGSQWFREHPVSVEQYLATATACGVDRAVLVQAHGAYGADNAYVLDAVAAAPDRFVSVVIVGPGDVPTLRNLAAIPRCCGVRLFGIGVEPPTWFDGDEGIALWDAAAELDLRIVATLFASDLPRLRSMLGRHADVPVVLDHCGFPDLSGGPPFAGAAPLFELAAFPNLHLKVTSHVLEEAGEDAATLVEHLSQVFGADRLVWGSDYPQTHDRSYAALIALGRDACSGLPAADRDLFLGGNALRLWPELTG